MASRGRDEPAGGLGWAAVPALVRCRGASVSARRPWSSPGRAVYALGLMTRHAAGRGPGPCVGRRGLRPCCGPGMAGPAAGRWGILRLGAGEDRRFKCGLWRCLSRACCCVAGAPPGARTWNALGRGIAGLERPGLVFTTATGSFLEPSNVNKAFAELSAAPRMSGGSGSMTCGTRAPRCCTSLGCRSRTSRMCSGTRLR